MGTLQRRCAFVFNGDYTYELALKSELVVEVFRQNDIIIDYPEVITDEKSYNYRNKMEYALY